MFAGGVDVRQISGGRWELLAPLTWTDAEWCITVPAGFVTDFASIPRLLWVLWPKSGAWNQAAVVHDWECRWKFRPCREVHARFAAMLQVAGVSWVTRQVLHAGVSQFGPTWNSMRLPELPYEVGPGALLGVPAGYSRCAP